jgi:hypothetical protein
VKNKETKKKKKKKKKKKNKRTWEIEVTKEQEGRSTPWRIVKK